MTNAAMIRALFPPKPRTTVRGQMLDACMRLRDTRAWIKPGCYAWWRYTDDLKVAQYSLSVLRRVATTGGA
jgi:hypothetical protein